MWYFKQTAKTLWQASKGMIVDNRSKVQKLLDQIAQSQEQIISTNKLNQLAAVTYDMQTFQQTLQSILKRIKTFQYDIDQARKNLNILIAVNYLLKHGASGFVDQLRNYINVFKKYQALKDLKTYQDQILQKQLSYQLQKIKSRARHIELLLEDKQKLLKQKQLAMLIKQKMKLYQKNTTQNLNNSNRKQRLQKQKQKQINNIKTKINNNNNNNNNNKADNYINSQSTKRKKQIKDYADKIDGFLQKYLWKYVDKIDDKIQIVTQKVMQNFDKYLMGQLPQNFEPQSIQNQQQQSQQKQKQKPSSNKKLIKQQSYSQYNKLQNDDDDLMKKLQEQGQNGTALNSNLIDFQQVDNQETQKDKKKNLVQQESLI